MNMGVIICIYLFYLLIFYVYKKILPTSTELG